MQLHEKLMSEYPDLNYVFDPFMPDKQKGWIHNKTIYLHPDQDSTTLNNTVAEEIAHYLTGSGNIANQETKEERKQENEARNLGATLLVTLQDIIDCYHQHLVTYQECAEFLDIPLSTLQRAVSVYASKSGGKIKYSHYTICFRLNGTIEIFDWFK
ncbi:ImmA/IrrE family metallo-endopeptidase [Enterococcus saccharolyticus]|uniref:ImmA/IrrE family metallo-endopeptidase n=1 Tax=Enterococcus saccharolyticus TaxID=41997 RepID=UPI0039DFFC39